MIHVEKWTFEQDILLKLKCSSEKVTLKDTWGYMDSQETVSISPAMFGEFFFPYYERVANLFGLVNYGCCEPVHPIWEKCISKLKNLRKVYLPPWCNEEYMGEVLRGSNVIFHRKPSPNYIGVGKNLDDCKSFLFKSFY